MITIKKDLLFATLGILSLLVEFSIFSNNNYLLSFTIFIYLCTVPGYLLLLALKLTRIDFWTTLVLSVGLSLFFLMIPGVIFNSTWSQFMPTAPLQKELLFAFYGTLILILGSIAYFRNREYELKILFEFRSVIKKIYFLIPPIITVLSIFAAIRLNNNASNSMAILSMSGIALSTFMTIFLHKRLSKHFFPWSLYFHSLSLLLLISLRSWYITGWDIQYEFKIFQVTNNFGVWDPENWNNAYNACLSITLLPTVISNLTGMPDDYIYKFFYQILFATTPVIIYLLFKKYAISIIAFIAVIYVISQPLFIQPMTALMRQEIAFIFFALMLLVLFRLDITHKARTLLFIIFGAGMVVSHYSTTYISLILLTLTFVLTGIYRLSEKIPFIESFYRRINITSSIKFYRYDLNPLWIISLFVFTFFWYGYINNQLGQVQKIAYDGIAQMDSLFKSEIQSGETKKAITFLASDLATKEEIDSFTKHELLKFGADTKRLYSEEITSRYQVFPMSPISNQPIIFSSINRNIIVGMELLKQVLKFCIILGPIYLLFFYFRKNTFQREYIILSGVAVLIIFIMTFHPTLGLQYNISRFYLQLLFFLALPAILLFLFIFSPAKKYAVGIVGGLTILLFVYLTGILNLFLGGEARLYLNNFGADYDKFYVHKTELESALWLKNNVNKNESAFYADLEANLRIYRIFEVTTISSIIPKLIYRDAYVYGSYGNIRSNRTTVYHNGENLVINFPNEFLNGNKNVIYSNGETKIFK